MRELYTGMDLCLRDTYPGIMDKNPKRGFMRRGLPEEGPQEPVSYPTGQVPAACL